MFQKGKSGNPSGRPKIAPEVKEAIQNNGLTAVRRMSELLNDDSAWGAHGWIRPREQILLATAGQERAYGKIENVAVDHLHGGSIVLQAKHARFQDVLGRISDQLPERISQRRIVEDAVLVKKSDTTAE